jgi:hypothetical protein
MSGCRIERRKVTMLSNAIKGLKLKEELSDGLRKLKDVE